MAALSSSASTYVTAAPQQSPWSTNLMRIATALAAVVGVWAMAAQEASSQTAALADGTYLYGESAVSDTVGATYFVFEVEDGNLSGAVYQPSSSFDCVYGTVATNQLNLTIVDAYGEGEWAHTVALLPPETTVASTSGLVAAPQLEGMQPISELTDLDRQLLQTCGQR